MSNNKVQCFLSTIVHWVWPTEHLQRRPPRASSLGSHQGVLCLWWQEAHPIPRPLCSIRQGLRAPGMFRREAVSLGQGRRVLLSPTSVDVFPVHSVLHKGNVVIGGQCKVRDAAHEALHVLSVRVQSDFLHSTCRGPRWRREWGKMRGHQLEILYGPFSVPWSSSNCLEHRKY